MKRYTLTILLTLLSVSCVTGMTPGKRKRDTKDDEWHEQMRRAMTLAHKNQTAAQTALLEQSDEQIRQQCQELVQKKINNPAQQKNIVDAYCTHIKHLRKLQELSHS